MSLYIYWNKSCFKIVFVLHFPPYLTVYALIGEYGDAFKGEDQSGWYSMLLAAFTGFIYVFPSLSCAHTHTQTVLYLPSEYQVPNLKSISTCSCALKPRREQGNFYKMCHVCWNRGVIFSVLLLTHLQYGMK